MKKNSTRKIVNFTQSIPLVIILLLFGILANAQVACPGGRPIYSEDFGTGTTSTAHPDVISDSLFFYESGSLAIEGDYRTVSSTQQKPEWHSSSDHTGNLNGKMLVVNPNNEMFFMHEVNSSAFVPGTYSLSLFLMNLDPKGLCGDLAQLPVIIFNVEYFSQAGTWVALQPSPYHSAPVAQTVNPEWVELGTGFTLPFTPGFAVTRLRITIGDEISANEGCGADFAMDDIMLALCPEGGITPVTFLGLNAHQQGNGIAIDWKTSQELNSDYFEVQRSADGNHAWSPIAKIPAAGNSQVVKEYSSFDVSPFSGANYYRLKQFDKDGKFEYSKIVSVRIDAGKIAASVLGNPFQNRLSVNFISPIEQVVTARLIDITGKQVGLQKWTIANGSSSKEFDNVAALQKGIYIISVTNALGERILNSKVIKQ
jgi:hypothetical protein